MTPYLVAAAVVTSYVVGCWGCWRIGRDKGYGSGYAAGQRSWRMPRTLPSVSDDAENLMRKKWWS